MPSTARMCDRKALPAGPRREHAGTRSRATAAKRRRGRLTEALAGRGALHEAGNIHHLRGERRVSSGRSRGAAQRGVAEASTRRRCARRWRDAPPERRESCSSACTGRTTSRSARPGCSRAPAQRRALCGAARQGVALATTPPGSGRDPRPRASREARRVWAALQTGRSARRQRAAGCTPGSPRTSARRRAGRGGAGRGARCWGRWCRTGSSRRGWYTW